MSENPCKIWRRHKTEAGVCPEPGSQKHQFSSDTPAQSDAFYTDADQMAIPNASHAATQAEGLVSVEDLAEFKKLDLEQVAKSVRAANLTFSAKSLKRLIDSSKMEINVIL